jgi:hypothetical protein
MSDYLVLDVKAIESRTEDERREILACAEKRLFDKLLFLPDAPCLRKWKGLPFAPPTKRVAVTGDVTTANQKVLADLEAAGLTPSTAAEAAKRRGCCDRP